MSPCVYSIVFWGIVRIGLRIDSLTAALWRLCHINCIHFNMIYCITQVNISIYIDTFILLTCGYKKKITKYWISWKSSFNFIFSFFFSLSTFNRHFFSLSCHLLCIHRIENHMKRDTSTRHTASYTQNVTRTNKKCTHSEKYWFYSLWKWYLLVSVSHTHTVSISRKHAQEIIRCVTWLYFTHKGQFLKLKSHSRSSLSFLVAYFFCSLYLLFYITSLYCNKSSCNRFVWRKRNGTFFSH